MTNLEIEAFLAICRQGTISRAAAELYISQSSLSTRLRTLEKELGYPLFLRQKGGREAELTEEGKKFYDLALQYQETVRKMFALADRDAPEKLRVSSINSVGTYLLPPVYERFMQSYPNIRLEIQDMEAEMACQRIAQGATDLAFTTENRESDQIEAFPVFEEPMALICSANSPCSDLVEREMLAAKNEVYIEWCAEFALWHRSVFGADAAPRVRLEIMGQLQHFVSKGDSWAIVPVSVARGLAETPEIRLCRMKFHVPERIVYALCARGMRGNAVVLHFLECTRKEFLKLQEEERVVLL